MAEEWRPIVQRFRSQGDFASAIRTVTQELASLPASGSPKWERPDLERELETLERITGLGAVERAAIQESDRLETEVDRSFAQGEFREAESAARRQLELREQVWGSDHPELISSLDNLGVVVTLSGDFASAERYLRRAAELAGRHLGSDHPTTLLNLNNLGGHLQERGEYGAAAEIYRQVLRIRRDLLGEDHLDTAQTWHDLAYLHQFNGKLLRAAPLYERSLTIRRRVLPRNDGRILETRNNLAVLHRQQGNLAEAEELFRATLDGMRETLGAAHVHVAVVERNLAGLLQDDSRLEEAAQLMRRCLETMQSALGDRHLETVSTRNNMAALLRLQGKREEASAILEDVLEAYTALLGPGHINVARVRVSLAAIAAESGEQEKAESMAREAVRGFRTALPANHPETVGVLQTLARVLASRGAMEEAEATLEEATRVFEAARVIVAEGWSRSTFRDSPYEDLARIRLRQSRGAEAWWATELARARSLEDMLRDDREVPTSPSPGTLGEGISMHSIAEIRLAEASSFLGRNEALVGWLDADDGRPGWAYVIRPERELQWLGLDSATEDPVPVEGPPAQEVLGRQSPAHDVWRWSRDRFDSWLAPLASALAGVTDATLVPSPAMWGTPLEALLEETDRWAGDRFAVSYAPSARFRSDRAKRSGNKGLLLLADPPLVRRGASPERPQEQSPSDEPIEVPVLRSALSGSPEAISRLAPLWASRREVESIGELHPSPTLLLGTDGSAARLRSMALSGELASFSFLHFATHALVDSRRPACSALVLSQWDLPEPSEGALSERPMDHGLLTVAEVAASWHLDADLVTLSACESGMGRKVRGEGFVGLAQAFFVAGARNVLVSLWPVDDDATALLMRRFYENIWGKFDGERSGRRGSPIPMAPALWEAKAWLRGYRGRTGRSYSHPRFWAAFVLIGVD